MEELKGFGHPACAAELSSIYSCAQQSMLGWTPLPRFPQWRENWDLSTLEDSPDNGNCTEQEDCLSEYKPKVKFYIGTSDEEDTTSTEDSTSECSSCHSLPPAQESRETESGRMPFGTQEQIRDDPEQLAELPIVQGVEVDVGSHHEDSRAPFDLKEHFERAERINQDLQKLRDLVKHIDMLLDKKKEGKNNDPMFSDSPLDKDLQLGGSSASPQMDHCNCQEHEPSQAGPKWKSPENDDISPFPENSPGLEKGEPIEMISQETGTEDNPSRSAGQPKEGDSPSHSESTSCLSIRSIARWLRKQVASCLPGRKRPDMAAKERMEPKKGSFLRCKRIQSRNPSS